MGAHRGRADVLVGNARDVPYSFQVVETGYDTAVVVSLKATLLEFALDISTTRVFHVARSIIRSSKRRRRNLRGLSAACLH